MNKYARIKELLRGFQRSEQTFFPGTVESVEGNTCTVKVDNLLIPNVRLQPTAEKSDDEVLLTPAVGCNVLVGSFSGDLSNLFVLQSDSISEAFLKIGETTFKVDKNGVEINGGKNAGVVNVKDMVNWMRKVHADLQALSTLLKTHPVAGNGAPLSMVFNVNTPNPSQSDFEDKNLTH